MNVPTLDPAPIDLNKLEKVALAATEGPWIENNDDGYGRGDIYSRMTPSGYGPPGPFIATVVGDSAQADDNANYIATFDPLTVLRLIALARSAPTPEPIPSEGWRPIESAPRDGTVIHVSAPSYEWPEVVRWLPYEPDAAADSGAEGYWTYAEELLASVTDSCCPEDWTHWMPLPPAPRGEGEG